MKRQWIRRTMVVFALVLLGWSLGAGGAQAAAKEVIFLSLTDFTGPVAGLALAADQGAEDYLKDINSKGGVEGVKVKYIGVDTRYDVARMLSAYKRYARNPNVGFLNIVSTPFGKMLGALTRKRKIPIGVPGDGTYQAHIGNFFVWGPPYQDAFAATLDWIKKDWAKKGKKGAPKVAIMSWDSPYGREPLRGGKEYAEKIGIKLLPSELFPVGTLKYDVYLTRLDKAGANYVYVGGVDPCQTNVMRDASRLGLTKKIQFISDYWGPSTLGINLHPEALEGMVIISFFLRGKESYDNALTKRIWTTYRKQPIEKMTESYGFGIVWGMNFEGALKDVIKRVGKDKISAEEMYKSYQNITGMDRQGIAGPCAYSPKSRCGSKVVKFYQCKGGKIVPITDWVKTPDAVSLHKW